MSRASDSLQRSGGDERAANRDNTERLDSGFDANARLLSDPALEPGEHLIEVEIQHPVVAFHGAKTPGNARRRA